MSLNYIKQIPHDANGNVLEGFSPAYKANARYSTNNATASSVITLNDNTTMIEVTGVGAPVAIRWIPVTETASVTPFASVITTSGGTANFDNIVGSGATRRFGVPIEGPGISSIVGIGVQAGTYRRVAIMSGNTVSSLMISEF